MKPLKTLLFLLPLAILFFPLGASAATVDGAGTKKSEIGLGTDLFNFKKTDDASAAYAALYKKADKKRRIAKAHRKALLRKVKKSK
ncbi:hypothetical protein WG947_04920 [Pontibacter sp. H259]|uniref:hypothetical protein n=1 Tax=Pontibacter sp. H259 TaxID=3133421 RepID=UPI0030C364D3